jgi:dimethylhistidine N-methyltransferase
MRTLHSASWKTNNLLFESNFARDVYVGLSAPQKTLPPQYFYDEVGSALFETITLLPEYGLTRAEERVLGRCALEIAQRLAPVAVVAELGSGSGRKTQHILEAMTGHQSEVNYFAIDVSAQALADCSRRLNEIRGIRAHEIKSSYLEGLGKVPRQASATRPLLLLFLGSTIGNFSDSEMRWFLRRVRQQLRPGDALMLGADLVKAPHKLIAAYDDPAGVTAAFNLNLLARINRELGGNFQLRQFQHQVRWVFDASRIEMHLLSLERQSVTIPAAKCTVEFEAGETIWTESSRKFAVKDLEGLATEAGFAVAGTWVDNDWPFAESLWIAESV